MKSPIKITEKLSVGAQPNHEEFAALKRQGFQGVINLRVPNEDQDMLAPVDEGDLVRAQGMEYLHIPVTAKQFRAGQVDDFRQCVDALDGPLFVHCKLGKRAGAFGVMYKAAQAGWSGDQALEEARKMGLECDDESLAEFVKQYVDDRAATGS